MKRHLTQIRQFFNDCSNPERILLYSAILPLFVTTPRMYSFSYQSYVYREFAWALLLFLAVGALLVEAFRGRANLPLIGRSQPIRAADASGSLPSLSLIPILIPAVGFVLWSMLSATWAKTPFWSLKFALWWGAYVLFLTLLCQSSVHRPFRRLFLPTAIGSWAILTLATIGTYYWRGFSIGGYGDLSQLLGAEVLAMFFPFCFGLWLLGGSRWTRLLGGISGFLFFWSLLQTGRRGPFLGLMVGFAFCLVMLLVIYWRQRRHGGAYSPIFNRTLWRQLALAIAFMVVWGYAQLTPSFLNGFGVEKSNLGDRFQATYLAGSGLAGRLEFWTAGYQMFADRPLVGQGADNFAQRYREFRTDDFEAGRPFGYFRNDEHKWVTRAHNEYIQVLAETGLIGFGLFGAFVILSLWLPLRAGLKLAAVSSDRAATRLVVLSLFGLGSMVSFYTSSMASSFSFRLSLSAHAFFVVFAASFALMEKAIQLTARRRARASEGPGDQEARTKSLSATSQVDAAADREGAPKGYITTVALALIVMSGLLFGSFRFFMSDLHYWKFAVRRGQTPGDLKKAIAWLPQNPGPHIIAAETKLNEVAGRNVGLDWVFQQLEEKGNADRVDQDRIIKDNLQSDHLDTILHHYDMAYRHGFAVSIIPAFKAVAAQAAHKPKPALQILEKGLEDFPDSPFLAAYYMRLGDKLDTPNARIEKNIRLVRKYQSEDLNLWQTYFEETKEEVEKHFMDFPTLSNYFDHFHRYYRAVRDGGKTLELLKPSSSIHSNRGKE